MQARKISSNLKSGYCVRCELFLVSESNTDSASGADNFSVRIHRFEVTNGVRHIDGDDRVTVQRDHHTETSGSDQVDCGHAEAGGQNAIEG